LRKSPQQWVESLAVALRDVSDRSVCGEASRGARCSERRALQAHALRRTEVGRHRVDLAAVQAEIAE